ncbi:DNA primase [Streptomyces sp. NPDC000151]|uniref:DNA primase n=1 Tax=Streptomyces sp. NPDC000151 TaxID=3154244 RepID=UPI00331F3578
MNNRAALALAVAGGYALGRTKKAKLALSVGGIVLGRRLQLDPQRLLGLVDERLKADPQLAELRDQLRDDLGGVGRAAADAFVSRRIDALADSLHARTAGVQEQLTGGTEETRAEDEEPAEAEGAEEADEAPDDERGAAPKGRTQRKKATGKSAPAAQRARRTTKTGTARTGTAKAGTAKSGPRSAAKQSAKPSPKSSGKQSGRSRERTDG